MVARGSKQNGKPALRLEPGVDEAEGVWTLTHRGWDHLPHPGPLPDSVTGEEAFEAAGWSHQGTLGAKFGTFSAELYRGHDRWLLWFILCDEVFEVVVSDPPALLALLAGLGAMFAEGRASLGDD